MQQWIPNSITDERKSQMIADDQDKANAMANYFGAVFTHEPLLDEEIGSNTNSTNRLLTLDFV